MIDIHTMTVKDIKQLLQQGEPEASLIAALAEDQRQGVQQLAEQYRKKLEKQTRLREQWDRMSGHERQLRAQGYSVIAGMDEVGRGPLAGPVVVAAVILPEDFYLPGLNDSKKVAPTLRESFYEIIIREAVAYSVAFSDAERIDMINIYQATVQAMRESIQGLSVRPDICLVDGLEVPSLPVQQLALVGGDGLSVSIAAASIIAKVTRDRWMAEAGQRYPEYGFEKNAGYGTADHLAAIAKFGPCPLHRKSFGGVKEWYDDLRKVD